MPLCFVHIMCFFVFRVFFHKCVENDTEMGVLFDCYVNYILCVTAWNISFLCHVGYYTFNEKMFEYHCLRSLPWGNNWFNGGCQMINAELMSSTSLFFVAFFTCLKLFVLWYNLLLVWRFNNIYKLDCTWLWHIKLSLCSIEFNFRQKFLKVSLFSNSWL